LGGEGTDRSSLVAGGMLETAGGQTGKQGSWRALQAEPGCVDGWERATLVSPYSGPWNSLGLAPHFQLSLGTPSHWSVSHLPPRPPHQQCCTLTKHLQPPFVHGSRDSHATSGQSLWMNPVCRLQATAVAAAAGRSPCLVHLYRTGPLGLWELDHLGSSDFHPHHHHSNQHFACHCHPSSAVAAVVVVAVAALKLDAVQSAAAVPFVAVAPTVAAVPKLAAVSAVAPKQLAAAPAVFVAVPQHTAPWWAHTAESAV